MNRNREPRIRDCLCRTPIFHQDVTINDETTLERSDVIGFMYYTDVIGCNNDSRLYAFGQVVDPRIQEGLEIRNSPQEPSKDEVLSG